MINQIAGYEIPVKENKNSSNGSSGSLKTQELESCHTPGPWRVEEDTYLVWGECSERENGIPIAEAHTRSRNWGRRVSHEEHEADVRLIAAAPDLLAAVHAALHYINNLNEEAPSYATCPECTSGSVPDKWNEGLCWIHLLKAATKGIPTRNVEAELRAEIERLKEHNANLSHDLAMTVKELTAGRCCEGGQ